MNSGQPEAGSQIRRPVARVQNSCLVAHLVLESNHHSPTMAAARWLPATHFLAVVVFLDKPP